MFKSREQAGILLSRLLTRHANGNAAVLAVPRGGVPVGYSVAKALRLQLDVVIPRKLPIPEEPEAGFGAVTADGTIVLNDDMVAQLGLPSRTIDAIVSEVLREIRRREDLYRKAAPRVDLAGREVILTDDGLATGYTMVAAIRSIRRQSPKRVIVAVPCAPSRSIDLITPMVDELHCVAQSDEPIFAVASFYEEFTDLTDDEVIHYLDSARAFAR